MLIFISFQILMICDIRYCSTTETDPMANIQEFTNPKIFWELNWLSQRDPKLIRFIKKNILIPPPPFKQPLNLCEPFDKNKPWKHQGTHGEALAVDTIYGRKRKIKTKEREMSKKLQ